MTITIEIEMAHCFKQAMRRQRSRLVAMELAVMKICNKETMEHRSLHTRGPSDRGALAFMLLKFNCVPSDITRVATLQEILDHLLSCKPRQ